MPKSADLIPMHNKHYFQTLLGMMTDEKPMVIDNSGTLWHRNDLTTILSDTYHVANSK